MLKGRYCLMFQDGKGRSYVFAKTFMDNHVLAKWLELDEFASGLDNLRAENQDINDVTILRLTDQIIDRHIDDEDNDFPLEWALKANSKFRKKIPNAYFDKEWLKSTYPDAWESLQTALDDGCIIIPFQMHKYICFVKYFSERAEEYNLCVNADGFNREKQTAQITVRLKHLFLDQLDQVSKLMKHMSNCCELEITSKEGETEIRIMVPNVFMPREEFESKNKRRAWTLEWNRKYISLDQASPLDAGNIPEEVEEADGDETPEE